MEVSYRRDLNKNYLCVEMEQVSGKEYPIRMLEQNKISEFLPFQLRRMNGKLYFYYEISSRQPLTQVFENRSMKWEEMERLVRGICDGIEHAQQYLLKEDALLLDPDYIYLNVETGQVGFCCMPFGDAYEENTLLTLAEFVLKKLDHGERKAVDLGYALFAQASLEQIGILERLQKLLQKKQDIEERKRAEEVISSEKEWDDDAVFDDFYEMENSGRLSEDGKWQLSDSKNGLKTNKRRKKEKGQHRQEKGNYRQEQRQYRQGKGQHRQEQRKQGERISWKSIGIIAGALLLLTVVFAGIVYFGKLDLTQTGGLAFLFLAVIWIIYSALEGRKEKKKTHWLDDEDSEEEEFEKRLLEDLYMEKTEAHYETEDHEELCGETRCLTGIEEAAGLRLVSLRKSEYGDIVMDREKMILGKKRDQVTVCISKDCISRIHAKLERKGEQYYITDLNSTNGTFVNGERLAPNEQRKIIPGDRINLATLRYAVKE